MSSFQANRLAREAKAGAAMAGAAEGGNASPVGLAQAFGQIDPEEARAGAKLQAGTESIIRR